MNSEILKNFNKHICNDNTLKKLMPKRFYNDYITSKSQNLPLKDKTVEVIAKAIKKWAIKNNATHYSHYFSPISCPPTEKQVSFMENFNGSAIQTFSKSALEKGETDASNFPCGEDRKTHKARGYTLWDYSSPIFIKETSNKIKTLYIPSVLFSYSGACLDDKTPLLRAQEKINNIAIRIFRHLGYNFNKIIFTVGAEQEYFLIKKKYYDKHIDLKFTGRTLLGKEHFKSQSNSHHYFSTIENEIAQIMKEINSRIAKMGIISKIQHCEVAPCQYELVPTHTQVNISCTQNQIIMQTIKEVAEQNGFVALFHEKPFNHLNGSGKHINFSFQTDNGVNLLDINQKDKTLFLLFFISIISAIDKYYKLLTSCCFTYQNDYRLGGLEAPPSYMSINIGSNLTQFLFKLCENNSFSQNKKIFETNIKHLPKIFKDFSDRNRTCPISYSGNKFEFRSVGSSQDISWPCTCILSSISAILDQILGELDKSLDNKKDKLYSVLINLLNKHKKIIFNGNCYSKHWRKLASERGFINFKNCTETYSCLNDEHIINLFEKNNILTKKEIEIRKHILHNNYVNSAILEAKTLNYILNKQVLPKLNSCTHSLKSKNAQKINNAYIKIDNENILLCKIINKIKKHKKLKDKEKIIQQELLMVMNRIRKSYDNIENLIPEQFEPFPTYNDILEN